MFDQKLWVFNQELTVYNWRKRLQIKTVVGDTLLLVDEDLRVDLPQAVHHLQTVREVSAAHQAAQLGSPPGRLLECDGGGEGVPGLEDHLVVELAGERREEVE